MEQSFFFFLGIVKSDSPASSKGFLSVLRMESGTSHPHCERFRDATVARTLLFLLLSYSLDQPTNYSHFFSFFCRLFLPLEGGGESGKGEEMGGVCDWVSPPLCCLAHDKPLLFYQDLPSLACLLQIAALFRSVLHVVVGRLCSALPNTLAYI